MTHGTENIHQQTILLLFFDPDFTKWMKKLRKQFDIPANGFKVPSKKLQDWYDGLDLDLWDSAIQSIYSRYRKINPAYVPYIERYVKFNKLEAQPEFGYRLALSNIDDKKIGMVTAEIFFPLSDGEWKELQNDVTDRFRGMGISGNRKLLKNMDLKQVALKERTTHKDSVSGEVIRQSDEDIVQSLREADLDPTTVAKMAKRLPDERKAMDRLLEERLGKVV